MKHLITKTATALLLFALALSSCKKEIAKEVIQPQNEEKALCNQAHQTVQDQQDIANKALQEFGSQNLSDRGVRSRNIVEIASSLPFYKSLVAAVVKTGLAGTLSSKNINVTVFAPTDAAFSKLPAPFNNAANITAISDQAQIDALKAILLYHVLGAEVKRHQVAPGRSNAVTLKPAGSSNDNTIYFSNSNGLLLVNGNSLVILADVDANNGVIHAINNVLIPPSQNIAQIAIGNPAFSSLVAALVKTNLAGVFSGTGNFTVFAPTDAAFSKLPAPFNNAANITAISDAGQITALANILKYHVASSRFFAWDLGILRPLTTIADAPNNRLVGILGLTNGFVKGNQNSTFAKITPANILATNGVVQVIDQVLLP